MAIGTTAAIIGGSLLGAAGSAISASSQSKAAKKAAQTAADTSLEVAEKNNQFAREIYDENKAALAPWQQYGQDAIPQINALLDMLPGGSGVNAGFDAYKESTGYDARLRQGMDAVRGGFSGAGTLQSGNTLKALTRYGQDYASGEFGNYVDSIMPRLNALTGQRDLGFNATSAQAGLSTNYSTNVQNNNLGAADAVSNAALYKAANKTSPFASALSMVGGGLYGFGAGG